MKQLIVAICCLFTSAVFAQAKFSPIDKSPMDMCYYPDAYPVLKIQDKTTETPVARVIYSRPQKNSRVIFSELVEYGKVWRLGANEATEIEFFKPVKIGSTKVKKGRYTLYCIPDTNKWTIIINKETDTWGAFKYNQSKDLLRYDVPVQRQADITEAFSMVFEKSLTGANLQIAWDDVKVALPIVF
ncbi:DUF2911 domain-containing protein [Ferruginibacter lapsinanis]|uniref:DUF2911 domain-containing protein n=1 Tax=Ferruginibacter lapsinanis TaxID=563172 RepID=UPI001E60E8A5|nr:DUF2911 domain-containing protein [Ferruginibacter lapsinanis]UEG50947.1 DUF2911 domain-containing protein [Ferruginibacter lapsinanis]